MHVDRILALAAILALALYLGVLIWRVPQPALIVVCASGVLLAAFDFSRSVLQRFRFERNNRRRPERG
jgi:uncharacterized membrane protein